MVGLLCLAYVTTETLRARRFQQEQTVAFERMHATPISNARSPHRRVVERLGAPVGVIDILRVGLSAVVSLGDDRTTLAKGAGLLADTSRPWAGSNTAIAAHRDGVFRPLSRIRKGDEIVLRTTRGTFRYRVRSTQVTTPDDLSVLAPTRTPTLTLITCYPFRYVGPAPKRFVVQADRVKPAKTKRATSPKTRVAKNRRR
jgi:sortase A